MLFRVFRNGRLWYNAVTYGRQKEKVTQLRKEKYTSPKFLGGGVLIELHILKFIM